MNRLGLRKPKPPTDEQDQAETEQPAVPSQHDEQRARAAAYDSAQAWAQAMAQVDQRLATWCARMTAARDAGTPPAVLLDHIRSATDGLGIEPEDVPAGVWRAAGIATPDGP